MSENWFRRTSYLGKMYKEIKNILACPSCKKTLLERDKSLICNSCKKRYNLSENVPVFLDNVVPDEDLAKDSFRSDLRKYPLFLKWFSKLHRIIGPPNTSFKSNNDPLNSLMKPNANILNIGSSSKKAYSKTVNLDIGLFKNVDVVADGKSLPFKERSFDLVIAEMVLEHVDDPDKVLNEANRVLKKNGILYVTIPFVFAFHGAPDDFNRYTLSGLKKRLEFAGFRVQGGGVLSGPSSTLSQVLRYYLATLFSFNSKFIFSLLLNIFGWLTFPIKYLDFFLNRYDRASLIAASIYAYGKKVD